MIVYKLTCLKDGGKAYVGSTATSLEKRISGHRYEASKSRSAKRPLYMAMREHGIEAFSISVIGTAQTADELAQLEAALIKEHDTIHPRGYNLLAGCPGAPHHADTRERLRQSRLGQKASPETIAKMRETRKNNPGPAREDVEKAWQALRGRAMPQEEKDRRSAIRKAHLATPEGRAQMLEQLATARRKRYAADAA